MSNNNQQPNVVYRKGAQGVGFLDKDGKTWKEKDLDKFIGGREGIDDLGYQWKNGEPVRAPERK